MALFGCVWREVNLRLFTVSWEPFCKEKYSFFVCYGLHAAEFLRWYHWKNMVQECLHSYTNQQSMWRNSIPILGNLKPRNHLVPVNIQVPGSYLKDNETHMVWSNRLIIVKQHYHNHMTSSMHNIEKPKRCSTLSQERYLPFCRPWGMRGDYTW